MSGPWGSMAGGVTGRWSVWKFNWLANHKIVAALERARAHVRGELLDVGCGSRPFEPLFQGRVTRYLGVDPSRTLYEGWTRPHVLARGEELPFRAGSFDAVLALSVLKYLPEPRRFVAEAARVLRPGGVLLVEITQMSPEDASIPDFVRFTRRGAEHLLSGTGLEPVEWIPVGGLWARVGLSLIAPLNRLNRGPLRPLTELPVRLAYVVLQVCFELLDRVFHDPREVLAHFVVARRIP